jgi:hypothetical protein
MTVVGTKKGQPLVLVALRHNNDARIAPLPFIKKVATSKFGAIVGMRSVGS